MKNIFHVFFRLLFGLSLIAIGLQGIHNIDSTVPHAEKTYNLITHHNALKSYEFLRKPAISNHIGHLVLAHYGLFIAGGLLSIFGFCTGKFLVFLGVAANIALIHNPYFYREDKFIVNSLKYLAVFGGAWNL